MKKTTFLLPLFFFAGLLKGMHYNNSFIDSGRSYLWHQSEEAQKLLNLADTSTPSKTAQLLSELQKSENVTLSGKSIEEIFKSYITPNFTAQVQLLSLFRLNQLDSHQRDKLTEDTQDETSLPIDEQFENISSASQEKNTQTFEASSAHEIKNNKPQKLKKSKRKKRKAIDSEEHETSDAENYIPQKSSLNWGEKASLETDEQADKSTLSSELQEKEKGNVKQKKRRKTENNEKQPKKVVKKKENLKNKCPDCNQLFYGSKKAHEAWHNKDSKFKCESCKVGSNYPSFHRFHDKSTTHLKAINQYKPENEIHCIEGCNNTFSSERAYLYHKQTVHAEHLFMFACSRPLCIFTALKKRDMERHQETTHGLTPCYFCGNNTGSIGAFKQHSKKEHNAETKCPQCEYSQTNHLSLITHIIKKHYKKTS